MAYTTLSDVKQYLGIVSADDDVLLSSLITYAQSYIDTYTSRVFEGTSETREYDDSYIYDDYLNIRDDICSIDSIFSGNTVQYKTYPNTPPYYAIKLLSSYGDNISVTGVFTYSLTAPTDIVYCAIRLVGYFYHLKDSQVFDVSAMPELGVIQIPKGIPKDVQLILDKYTRMVTY